MLCLGRGQLHLEKWLAVDPSRQEANASGTRESACEGECLGFSAHLHHCRSCWVFGESVEEYGSCKQAGADGEGQGSGASTSGHRSFRPSQCRGYSAGSGGEYSVDVVGSERAAVATKLCLGRRRSLLLYWRRLLVEVGELVMVRAMCASSGSLLSAPRQ
jgi:hypothetical protein